MGSGEPNYINDDANDSGEKPEQLDQQEQPLFDDDEATSKEGEGILKRASTPYTKHKLEEVKEEGKQERLQEQKVDSMDAAQEDTLQESLPLEKRHEEQGSSKKMLIDTTSSPSLQQMETVYSRDSLEQSPVALPNQLDVNGTPIMMDRIIGPNGFNGERWQQNEEKRQQRDTAYMSRLIAVSITLTFFLSALCSGGYIAGSLALMTSPALMASELLGFSMSISALSATNDQNALTFGRNRAEVVGLLL